MPYKFSEYLYKFSRNTLKNMRFCKYIFIKIGIFFKIKNENIFFYFVVEKDFHKSKFTINCIENRNIINQLKIKRNLREIRKIDISALGTKRVKFGIQIDKGLKKRRI